MIPLIRSPILVVISAPSGAGKTTLCHRLLAEFSGMRYSVSCTTRRPREGEVDGRDYHFLDEASFLAKREAGAFVESALVHGYYYGTQRTHVVESLNAGHDVLMDIDVQGARQIREALARLGSSDPLRRGYVDIFIAPPSIEALRQRLRGRGKDAEEIIERRVARAAGEMDHWQEYQYLVVNEDLEAAYAELRSILVAEHCRVRCVHED